MKRRVLYAFGILFISVFVFSGCSGSSSGPGINVDAQKNDVGEDIKEVQTQDQKEGDIQSSDLEGVFVDATDVTGDAQADMDTDTSKCPRNPGIRMGMDLVIKQSIVFVV